MIADEHVRYVKDAMITLTLLLHERMGAIDTLRKRDCKMFYIKKLTHVTTATCKIAIRKDTIDK